MVCDLTGLPVANGSLLDEATAAAEAMTLIHRIISDESKNMFFVAGDCHPQTIEVVRTRAEPLGIEVILVFLRVTNSPVVFLTLTRLRPSACQ
jgi:glycine dehydrogenase